MITFNTFCHRVHTRSEPKGEFSFNLKSRTKSWSGQIRKIQIEVVRKWTKRQAFAMHPMPKIDLTCGTAVLQCMLHFDSWLLSMHACVFVYYVICIAWNGKCIAEIKQASKWNWHVKSLISIKKIVDECVNTLNICKHKHLQVIVLCARAPTWINSEHLCSIHDFSHYHVLFQKIHTHTLCV